MKITKPAAPVSAAARTILTLGVTMVIAMSSRADAQSNEFVPFDRFLEGTQSASSMQLRGPKSKVLGRTAFDEMHRHLLNMYRGVQVRHSFVKDASHFDCIPVEQQASVRLSGLDHVAAPPPQSMLDGSSSVAQVAPEQSSDEFGNAIGCEGGTIPVRRITLEEMTQFPDLRRFFEKKPEAPSDPSEANEAPLVNAASHKYAYMQQTVDNLGGNSNISLWSPNVNTALGEVFSLSQAWYVGGSGAATQTVEVGWQNYPAKYGSQKSALFIYWTADNYTKTGCYNLECPAFVQVSGNGMLGSSFSVYSTAGGAQQEFSARFLLHQGNWWLAINGTWIGYYPGSIYKGGQLTRNAQSIKFGTESVGATVWPAEGSGYWSTSGWTYAAYQRNLFYSDTTGTLRWSTLTAVNPSPKCYSASGPYSSSSSGWNVYFYAGGPGGSGC